MNAAPGLRVYYGGTFDPVHDGHLAIARAARDALQAEIRLLPAADPPHRPAPGASAAQRVEMLQRALSGERGLLLDTFELQREERSWSVDTLHALRAQFGARQPIAWLVGADSFLGLPGWKHWRELFVLTHFVVAERPGYRLDDALPPALARTLDGRWSDGADDLHNAPAGRVLRLQQPLQPQSATELRRRIGAGQPWRQWLPPAVAEYIQAHGLYGAAPSSGRDPLRV